jgi:hypothetical protein
MAASNFWTLLCSFLALTALLISTPAWGQNLDDVPPPPPSSSNRDVSITQNGMDVSIGGQVLRTKQVDDRLTNEKVLVALLDLGDGERRIVDLGPTRIYKDNPIYARDQIAVSGPLVRLGNADVLLATEVHVHGEKVVVPRPAIPVARGYAVTEPELKIYGRIEGIKPARLRDSRTDHLVARVVETSGGAVVVDLGPREALWRADLRTGDWVTIYGQQMQVGDRPVILAREINKGGTPLLIERDLVATP